MHKTNLIHKLFRTKRVNKGETQLYWKHDFMYFRILKKKFISKKTLYSNILFCDRIIEIIYHVNYNDYYTALCRDYYTDKTRSWGKQMFKSNNRICARSEPFHLRIALHSCLQFSTYFYHAIWCLYNFFYLVLKIGVFSTNYFALNHLFNYRKSIDNWTLLWKGLVR